MHDAPAKSQTVHFIVNPMPGAWQLGYAPDIEGPAAKKTEGNRLFKLGEWEGAARAYAAAVACLVEPARLVVWPAAEALQLACRSGSHYRFAVCTTVHPLHTRFTKRFRTPVGPTALSAC